MAAREFLGLLQLMRAAENDVQRPPAPEPVMRDRTQAFEIPEEQFRRLFRLPIHLVRFVIDEVRYALPPARRSSALTVETKVLVALRFFFATGSYQGAVGQDLTLRVSQRSVSRCIRAVSDAILHVLLPQWVKFPLTAREQGAVKQRFMQATNMPGVIGAVDCTHIAIIAPSQHDEQFREHLYLNRKNFHSINVQLICDYDLLILNANAKFPGSTHDSHIWRSSRAREVLEQAHAEGNRNAWLLGDSGYPLEPWLMTPILQAPVGSPEENYNTHHSRARAAVERCNGVLKSRFRCLLQHRTLHYSPTTASKIINSCVVLHNICVKNHFPNPENADGEEAVAADDDLFPGRVDRHDIQEAADGRRIREQLVRRHF